MVPASASFVGHDLSWQIGRAGQVLTNVADSTSFANFANDVPNSIGPDLNGTVIREVFSCAVFTKFCYEDISWFLHEWVAVSSPFNDSGFQSPRSVRNFTARNPGKHLQAVMQDVVDRVFPAVL